MFFYPGVAELVDDGTFNQNEGELDGFGVEMILLVSCSCPSASPLSGTSVPGRPGRSAGIVFLPGRDFLQGSLPVPGIQGRPDRWLYFPNRDHMNADLGLVEINHCLLQLLVKKYLRFLKQKNNCFRKRWFSVKLKDLHSDTESINCS